MNPIAFSINGFDVRWYGVIIGTGVIMALILGNINCKARNYNFDNVMDVFLIFLPICCNRSKSLLCIF
ncbi:prolipoprotein diacylglyceryl transferase [Clostridium carboxidivorans P7]|uniref:Prolipoprotein diacylglyceryl transferase n=1 Tax=Clostridium carboxidivorans P7 TaxID=536227 RepID=C6PTX1_9CLOT|nr:prolipoprotein diacylglyceryl transferase [Clostridium carboxidivorans P7]